MPLRSCPTPMSAIPLEAADQIWRLNDTWHRNLPFVVSAAVWLLHLATTQSLEAGRTDDIARRAPG